MRPIEYISAKTVQEAVTSLAEKGDTARPLAGGTDIIVQLRGGRRQLDRLVDLKAIPELNDLTYNPDSGLRIGAAVPCYLIYGNEEVASAYPGLIDAASLVGGIQIQGRGSIGGNLCNAAPSGDTIPALIAHSAVAEITGPDGSRDVPVEEFCTAPGRTVLRNGEVLVAIHMPPPPAHFGSCYLRFIPRNEMDIAVVGAGINLTLDQTGVCQQARVSLGAVAPTVLLVETAANALVGSRIDNEALDKLEAAARGACNPIDDKRGTVQFRVDVAGVLARRAALIAKERAEVN